MNDTTRRDYVLSEAIAAGKFGESRRAHWQGQYDRDPAGTEQVLAALVSVHPEPPYPRSLFPELDRRQQRPGRAHATATATAPPPPPTPAATGDISDEVVAGWSRSLFPETASASSGRVTRAHD
jgi:hypothetical protein